MAPPRAAKQELHRDPQKTSSCPPSAPQHLWPRHCLDREQGRSIKTVTRCQRQHGLKGFVLDGNGFRSTCSTLSREIRMLLPNTQSSTHSIWYLGNIQNFLGVLAPDRFYSVLQMPGKYLGWAPVLSVLGLQQQRRCTKPTAQPGTQRPGSPEATTQEVSSHSYKTDFSKQLDS